MDDSHILTRADQRIIRGAYRNSEVKESGSMRHVPAYIDALIRNLAETYSQKKIAEILNQQLILRPNGLLWQQFHVCRYFQAHGIQTVHKWKGSKNIAHLK